MSNDAAEKLPGFLKENPDGSVSATLSRPVEISGAMVSVITLREPDVSDQLAAQKSAKDNAGQELALLANLAELDPEDLHRVKLRDYGRLQVALGFFMN